WISCFFFEGRRRHTRFSRDWSSDVCSSDLDTSRLTAAFLKSAKNCLTSGRSKADANPGNTSSKMSILRFISRSAFYKFHPPVFRLAFRRIVIRHRLGFTFSVGFHAVFGYFKLLGQNPSYSSGPLAGEFEIQFFRSIGIGMTDYADPDSRIPLQHRGNFPQHTIGFRTHLRGSNVEQDSVGGPTSFTDQFISEINASGRDFHIADVYLHLPVVGIKTAQGQLQIGGPRRHEGGNIYHFPFIYPESEAFPVHRHGNAGTGCHGLAI